ncbi:hypothetical protein BgiBS90_014309, partial [Biomphalaria glabrata]
FHSTKTSTRQTLEGNVSYARSGHNFHSYIAKTFRYYSQIFSPLEVQHNTNISIGL